jgi:hypothetical protein
MAIILDERARAAIRRRRARQQGDALLLRVETLPLRGITRVLAVDWAPRRLPRRPVVARRVGDAVVYVDARVARYTDWQDVTVSAWRLGPLDRPLVRDEPLALLQMERWERMHRGLGWRPAA